MRRAELTTYKDLVHEYTLLQFFEPIKRHANLLNWQLLAGNIGSEKGGKKLFAVWCYVIWWIPRT